MVVDLLDQVVFQAEPRRYTYRGTNFGSVTEKIKAAGFGPDFSYVPIEVMAYARRRGNMVDLALTKHYKGTLDQSTVAPAILGYFNGALKFDRECPGTVVAIHEKMASTALNVAGTLDIVRFIHGRRGIVDWKTGIDNQLQTAIYYMLWNMKHPAARCSERYGLKLNQDGTYRLKQHHDPDDMVAAMDILSGNKEAIEKWRRKYSH